MTPRLPAAVLAAVLAVGALSGCGDGDPGSVANQAKAGDGKGYIAGDGAVETVEPAKRGAAVDLKGTTLDGKPWSTQDVRGKVVVLNVWGSWCAPCVKEIPHLEKAWQRIQPKGAQLMGIDYRESADTGAAFLRSQKVTYPSLADDGGKALLALQGRARTTPTTLVLDKEGRIAARVAGPVDENTLVGLVDDVLQGG